MAFNLGQLNYNALFTGEEYDCMYKNLKMKYSKQLIENWTECTDPYKFVYEDLGIASYLLLLWRDQGPCNFLDLGCGNGLLVYILSEEGHTGLGLDVRKRKIWNTYPPSTVLKEETIIPSSQSVYPEADWLIGNHSDELTAWLPIMASRSNRKCQFFTIPCCPYKLNGAKFQRRKTQISIYQDFLEYVQELGTLCGFYMLADKLRIPSTKRVCLIGKRQEFDLKQLNETDNAISSYLAAECQGDTGSNAQKTWIGDFTPRVAVEAVRNCTRVPKGIQEEILQQVIAQLLAARSEGNSWNRGIKMEISALANSLSPDLLKMLKLECKGLQTLLKNHHQIFEVRKGAVQLRSAENLLASSRAVKKGMKWKQKQCWFHKNHPDGCPLIEDDCSYQH